ncbi:hypothetical protein AB0B50_00485 [Streptomyces sp. NPDC041068]|uniref:hypothetical protein n=1 Tax=Streptomyces sp. NPDC041068 TaxID=3155130 RepID=UPI0033E0FCF3
MPERDEQSLAMRRTGHRTREDVAREVHPALGRFLRSVDAEVKERLTEETVESRLRDVLAPWARETVPAPLEESGMGDFATRPQWAAYGYHVVQLWLTAMATPGRIGVRLRRDDIDGVAVETAARAVNSFRAQAGRAGPVPEPRAAGMEVKTVFLAECVRHLPFAHRSRQLMNSRLPFDEFEEVDEVDFVQMLGDAVTPEHAETLRRVGLQEHWHGETDEIITLTPGAVRTAVRRYPEATGPSPLP